MSEILIRIILSYLKLVVTLQYNQADKIAMTFSKELKMS